MNIFKHIFILFLFIGITSTFSQQVLNGGFEETNEFNFETYWFIGFGYNCFDPPFPVFATIVNDSNTGNNAAKLSSNMCYPEEELFPGTIYTNDNEPNSPTFGYEYHERPASLNFYYKYQPTIHGEIAFVKIMLFKFDYSNYTVTEVIGIGEANIVESTLYTLQTVPIDYYTESTPDYIHILFSTSDHFTYYQDMPLYNPNVDNVNSLGTNLWIDNVYVSGGSVGVNEDYLNIQIGLYPNPVTNLLNIKSTDINIQKVQIYTSLGQLVLVEQTNFTNIDVSNLLKGAYVVKIETKSGVFIKKVLKQ